MRIFYFAFLAFLSTHAFADKETYMQSQGRSYEYQQGFRDGFAEGQRSMSGNNNNWNNGNNNDFGGNGGSNDNTIRVLTAMYGSNAGSCDFTERLARTVEGKTSYFFKPSNNWCGDPSNGVAKEARIEYRCSQYGRTKRIVVPEGRSEYLRCN